MFKVGDKVRTKTAQEIIKTCEDNIFNGGGHKYHEHHSGIAFPPEMYKYCGKEYEVFQVSDVGYGKHCYTSYILDGVRYWNWHEDWICTKTEVKLPEDLFTI